MKLNEQKRLFFLKLTIENHPLFKDKVSFSLINDSRVNENNSSQLTQLLDRVWINNLVTIVGKNATGKTTIMRILIGMLSFLLEGKSIDETPLKNVLIGSKPITMTTYFYGTDGFVYKDSATFQVKLPERKWHVISEKIYQKKVNKTTAKSQLLNFANRKPITDRDKLDEVTASILAVDDSIFRSVIAREKYVVQPVIDTVIFTNVNALFYDTENVPEEILNFLDPTIEYLKVERKNIDDENGQLFFRLKFKNRPEVFTETSFETIEHYLSSGTSKGVTLYGNVLKALKYGGIIFIDELENHFNHAIVKTFIEWFADPTINVNRAVLVFSTHYSELLSDMDRSDEIYIAKRDQRIYLQRYSKADVRKDLNKTDVFDSDYLGGTAPEYDTYLALKDVVRRAVTS